MEAIIAAFKCYFDCLQHICFLKVWTKKHRVNCVSLQKKQTGNNSKRLFLYSRTHYLFSKGILNSRTIYLKYSYTLLTLPCNSHGCLKCPYNTEEVLEKDMLNHHTVISQLQISFPLITAFNTM